MKTFRWLLAAVLLLTSAAVSFLPTDPAGDGPEAGYFRDLLTHDQTAMDLIAEVRSVDLGADDEALLERISTALTASEESAMRLLRRWDVDPTRHEPAMSWMGHVVLGATPGQIADADIAPLAAMGPEERMRSAFAMLFGQLRGSVLMSRGLLGLSTDEQTIDAVVASVDERNALVGEIEARFVREGELPPTWLASMTTDPGELDHGDPVGSLRDIATGAIPWIPLALGLIVAVLAAFGTGTRPTPTVGLAALCAALAGLGHIALAAPHNEDSAIAGLFFVVVGIGQVTAAALLVGRPSPSMLNVAATMAMGLAGIYVLFRIYPPPGSVGPADVDLAGVVLVGLQLVVVGVWAMRPFGGDVDVWGADAILILVSRGAATGPFLTLLMMAGFIGFVIGETDSRPPSQIDVGFAQDMSVHHSQAVQLSQVVEGRLSDVVVNTFRREVPIFQQYELGVMQTRLVQWGRAQPGNGLVMEWMGMEMPVDEMPGMISQAQFDVLAMTEGRELDEMFLVLLSTHHVGGVQMAAFAAENADDASLAELAGRIARNQRIEIFEYDQLMGRLGYASPPGSLTMDELEAIATLAVQAS